MAHARAVKFENPAALMESLTTSDLLVDHLVACLETDDGISDRQREVWARLLRNNGISSATQLAHIDITVLSSMGLPLMVETELQRLAQLFSTIVPRSPPPDSPRSDARGKNSNPSSARSNDLTGSHRGHHSARRVPSDLKNSNLSQSSDEGGFDERPVPIVNKSSKSPKPSRPLPFDDPTFGLKESERETILSSYRLLSQNNEMFRKFVKELKMKFMQVSPTARRLFVVLSDDDHVRMFSRLFVFLVGFLDSETAHVSLSKFAELNGRHVIYGVQPEDFTALVQCFMEVLPAIFGSVLINKDILSAWRKLLDQFTKHSIAVMSRPDFYDYKTPIYWDQPKGWIRVFVKMNLTTIYIYTDEAETRLKTEYPLNCIDSVSFPESPMKFAVDMHSEKLSGLVLNLACENAEIFHEYLDQVNWRIVAHQRAALSAFDPSDYDEEDVESSRHTAARARQKVEKTMKALERKRRGGHGKSRSHSARSSPDGSAASSAAGASTTLGMKKSAEKERVSRERTSEDKEREKEKEKIVTPVLDEAELVQWTWKTLIEFKDPSLYNVSAVGRFTEDLVQRISKSQSHLADLFGKRTLIEQRGLARAVDFIARASGGGLDSSLQFADALLGQIETNVAHLGSVHAIYGAEPDDYLVFAECIVESLDFVLGPQIITESVKLAWKNVVLGVQQLMNNRPPAYDIHKAIVMRQRKKKKWKACLLSIDLSTLYIYASDKGDKIKTTHPIAKMTHVEMDHVVADANNNTLIIDDDLADTAVIAPPLPRSDSASGSSGSLRGSHGRDPRPVHRTQGSGPINVNVTPTSRRSDQRDERMHLSSGGSVSMRASTGPTTATPNKRMNYFIIYSSDAPHSFTFGCSDVKEAAKWVHEIKWRIEATRRARGEYTATPASNI